MTTALTPARDALGHNSLGFDKSPGDTRVAAAMSGGVDSSVVAALLAQDGYDVVGLTMQLYDHGAALAKKGACCAGRDIHDARKVAEAAGFPHYVLDYESLFRETVIDEFADSYLAGATPIPCVRCNERVKFKDLMRMAKDLDADCLATGHYVRRTMGPGGPELRRAADPARDQSYFLFTITPSQLEYLRFPLGDVATKAETRAMASDLGLTVADKPDSQDICFVPDGKYADLIRKLRPGAARPGDIVHIDGRVLGTHDGVLNFTIGQRRGIGVATGEPIYVVKLDADAARVIVGPAEALEKRDIYLKDINWLGDIPLEEAPADGWDLDVKTRSTRPPVAARLRMTSNGPAVRLAAPERGVAPGQACVFYDGVDPDRVLGGGWITRSS